MFAPLNLHDSGVSLLSGVEKDLNTELKIKDNKLLWMTLAS